MAISLPSRTAATMPQPHEQKLHEVVYSCTCDNFIFCEAALTVGMSRIPLTANPAPAPRANFSMSLRLTTLFRPCGLDCTWLEEPSLLSGFLRSMRHTPGGCKLPCLSRKSEVLHEGDTLRS